MLFITLVDFLFRICIVIVALPPVIVYAYTGRAVDTDRLLFGTCCRHIVTKLYLHYCARQKKQVFFASKIMSGARGARYRAKIIHITDYKELTT